MSNDLSCPLCGRPGGLMKPKKLFGHDVCKKCSSGFANRRQFAYFMDTVLIQILQMVATFVLILAIAGSVEPTGPGEGMSSAEVASNFVMVAALGLLLIKDGFNGTSPGKYLMGVQALDEATRQPIGFGASFKRNLPTMIPVVPLVIAVQLIKGKRWGDKWAGTYVIWRKYADNPIFSGGPPLANDGFGPATISLPPVVESSNPYQAPRR